MARTEIGRIIAFVSDRRSHVETDRQRKRRRANVRFAVTAGDAGERLAMRPKGHPVCPLPRALCA